LRALRQGAAPVRANALWAAMRLGLAGSGPIADELQRLRGDPSPLVRRVAGAAGPGAGGATAGTAAGPAATALLAGATGERRKDWIAIKLVETDGAPTIDEPYLLRLPSGELKVGWTDSTGDLREERVAPGACEVELVRRGR
jgi:hypothetical protein